MMQMKLQAICEKSYGEPQPPSAEPAAGIKPGSASPLEGEAGDAGARRLAEASTGEGLVLGDKALPPPQAERTPEGCGYLAQEKQ